MALVVPSESTLHYAMGRTLSSYAEPRGLHVRIFTSVNEAERWTSPE
jgi:hypothetical protein